MVHLITSWTTRKTKIAAAHKSNLYFHHQKDHDHDSSSQSLLLLLAEKNKFDLLLQELNSMSDEKFNKMLLIQKNQDNSSSSSSSSSILHVILSYRPPLDIVEVLLNRMSSNALYPVPEEIKDTSGKTPLHVAVAVGCHVSVIDRLLSGVSLLVPALTKDLLDRYPLHYACCCIPHYYKNSCGLLSSVSGYRRVSEHDKNRSETIYLLLNTYPVAVVIPDIHGKTPLDYALENKLDAIIIEALQTVTKHHQQYKIGVVRQLSVTTPTAANTTTKPRKQSHRLLKRKLLLGNSKCSSSSSPANVIGTPPTSEMTTERDSTDAANEDEDNIDDFLPILTKNSSDSNFGSNRRNMLRLDSNHMDDLSSLGWDILSAGGAASAAAGAVPGSNTKKSNTNTPIVRAKTLTVSPTVPTTTTSSLTTAAVATTTVLSSHSIRACRCKSLLRGRFKKKKRSNSKSNRKTKGSKKKKTSKTQHQPSSQQQQDITVEAAATTATSSVEPKEQATTPSMPDDQTSQAIVVVLVGQQDEQDKTVGHCRRFLSV